MEIVNHIDAIITIFTIAALVWFLVGPDKERSTRIVAILYLAGAPFDMISGRESPFWISMVCSLMYLYLHRSYRKERFEKEKKEKELNDSL